MGIQEDYILSSFNIIFDDNCCNTNLKTVKEHMKSVTKKN